METTQQEQTITKMHQQVAESLASLKGVKSRLSTFSTKYGLEVDILITEWDGIILKKPIAIEVNGAHHYPRNSENEIGKD